MADSWVLPFEEVIDWTNQGALIFHEKELFGLPYKLLNIEETQILELRQQGIFLYHSYFSSVEKIITTLLEIIRERIFPQFRRPKWVWNSGHGISGPLAALPASFSKNYVVDYPSLLYNNSGKKPDKFAAIIHVITPYFNQLTILLKNISKSKYCGQIILVYNLQIRNEDQFLNQLKQDFNFIENFEIIKIASDYSKFNESRIDIKFDKTVLQKTIFPNILSLDDDAIISIDEIDYGFEVYQANPTRIVGYSARFHHYLNTKIVKKNSIPNSYMNVSRWAYTSKSSNDFSLVMTGGAFVHRYFLELYNVMTKRTLEKSLSVVDQYKNCEDLLLNFIISSNTGRAPIKILQKKRYKSNLNFQEILKSDHDSNNDNINFIEPNNAKIRNFYQNYVISAPLIPRWNEANHFQERQICLNKFADDFGFMPLVKSQCRMDPTLYLDKVAAWRKEYRGIELTVDD